MTVTSMSLPRINSGEVIANVTEKNNNTAKASKDALVRVNCTRKPNNGDTGDCKTKSNGKCGPMEKESKVCYYLVTKDFYEDATGNIDVVEGETIVLKTTLYDVDFAFREIAILKESNNEKGLEYEKAKRKLSQYYMDKGNEDMVEILNQNNINNSDFLILEDNINVTPNEIEREQLEMYMDSNNNKLRRENQKKLYEFYKITGRPEQFDFNKKNIDQLQFRLEKLKRENN